MKRIDKSIRDRLIVAQEKLNALALYPKSLDINKLHIYITRWPFIIIWPQYDGIALGNHTILFKHENFSDSLLIHELCHLLQSQNHGRIRTLWAYLKFPYMENPYEIEARAVQKLCQLNKKL